MTFWTPIIQATINLFIKSKFTNLIVTIFLFVYYWLCAIQFLKEAKVLDKIKMPN